MSAGVLGAIQLVGSVAGPLIGGMEDRSALKASAAADRENANRTLFQGELDAWQTQREARLAQGAGLAQAAGDGNVVGTGTIADLVEQAALEREMEIGNLRARARGEAYNLQVSAANKDKQAGMALFKGILGGAMGYAATKADQRNAASVTAANARDRASRTGSGIVAGDQPGSQFQMWWPNRPRTPWGALPARGY